MSESVSDEGRERVGASFNSRHYSHLELIADELFPTEMKRSGRSLSVIAETSHRHRQHWDSIP